MQLVYTGPGTLLRSGHSAYSAMADTAPSASRARKIHHLVKYVRRLGGSASCAAIRYVASKLNRRKEKVVAPRNPGANALLFNDAGGRSRQNSNSVAVLCSRY